MDDVMRQGHVEVLAEIFADDAKYEGPPPKLMKGRAGIRQAVLDAHQAFDDWGPRVARMIAERDSLRRLEGSRCRNLVGNGRHGPPDRYPILHVLEIHDGVITGYADARDKVTMWPELGGVPLFLCNPCSAVAGPQSRRSPGRSGGPRCGWSRCRGAAGEDPPTGP